MQISLSNLSHKSLLTIFVALLFVVIYGVSIWYVRHLENTVRAQGTELAMESARETSLRKLSAFLDELSVDEGRLSSFFVAPNEAVRMIEQVEGLGQTVDATVSISGVQIKDKNELTGEGTMTMNVVSEGTWTEMTQLLALLDTFPLASHLASVVLSRIDDGGEQGVPTWSLRAVMHTTLRN